MIIINFMVTSNSVIKRMMMKIIQLPGIVLRIKSVRIVFLREVYSLSIEKWGNVKVLLRYLMMSFKREPRKKGKKEKKTIEN